MARIILVHGAFHNASCWDAAKAELEAKGHTVEAVDLPSHGSDSTPIESVVLQTYADKVVAQAKSQPEVPVLVGHSMGGMVVTQAADDILAGGGTVAQVVYVCAFLPRNGQSLVELAGQPEGAGDMVQANVVVDGEPPIGTMPTDKAIEAFYGECDPAVAQAAAQELDPQPILAFVMPANITDDRDITRRYIVTTHDKALPTPLQRKMSKATKCVEIVDIDSDHSPFLSHTDEFVGILDRFVKA